MKAFVYTLILSAFLVGCIILLFSIEISEIPPSKPRLSSPIVSSQPAHLGEFDLNGMETAKVEDIYTDGTMLLDLWHVKEATKTFEEAARRDSSFLEVFSKLVECYSEPFVCREDEARASWRHASTIAAARNANDTVFVNALGDLYLEADYEAAARGFERLIEETGRDDNTLYYLATAWYRQGEVDKAERHVKTMLQRDESNGRARALLIRCAVVSEDLDGAAALAKDLAALYSEEPYPYVLLAQVELIRGDVDEALAFCNNALTLDPKYIPAILCKGNLYAVLGEQEAARATFEKLFLFDDPILVSLGSESIAFVEFLWGRFDEGSEMMDDAIRNAVLVGSVRRGLYYALRLVDYLCQLGQVEKAAVVVERWFSGFGSVPYRLGGLRLEIYKGNLDRAQQILDEAARGGKWRSWMRMIGLDWGNVAALAHVKDRRYKQALELLEQSGRSEMAGEERSYLKGYAAFESGDAEFATTAFEKVLTYPREIEFPFHHDPIIQVQTLFYLAEADMARGDRKEAVKNYQAFINYWGEPVWEMPAVSRAKEKLNTLSTTSVDG